MIDIWQILLIAIGLAIAEVGIHFQLKSQWMLNPITLNLETRSDSIVKAEERKKKEARADKGYSEKEDEKKVEIDLHYYPEQTRLKYGRMGIILLLFGPIFIAVSLALYLFFK